ncbi:positive regulation of fibroblast apoptotic process [Marasmius crinis-equi]|uniref:Positive regulation of fibroblast apoptotic process n=1 Tax=Marasmius crinis-equi TaxID=585013 RepID=A0ABR3EXC7_9AGAR
MSQYKPYQLHYLMPNEHYPIHDLNDVPSKEDLPPLLSIGSSNAHSSKCTRGLPTDGACLNLVVEEPLLINDVPAEDISRTAAYYERFRSREVVLFLNQHHAEIFPIYGMSAAHGYMGHKTNAIWCKVVHKQELERFKSLEPYHPSSHHVAKLLLHSDRLPNDRYLIVMPHYGCTLSTAPASRFLGTAILELARQLCRAVRFLHSHGFYHLDIKPHNIAIDPRICDITLIDLGWMTRREAMSGAAGTYDYAPPEIRRWFDWEENQDGEQPRLYHPRYADVWAIGKVVRVLIDSGGCFAEFRGELEAFARWVMKAKPRKRPTVDEALSRLEEMGNDRYPSRSASASRSKEDCRFETVYPKEVDS